MSSFVRRLRIKLMRRILAVQGGSPEVAEVVAPDGAPIQVHEQGDGPPILMLHPGSSTWTAWQPVAGQLCGRFRVAAFDRRPYRAQAGARPFSTMAAETADALAVARHLGRAPLLVGHSSGGVAALEAALAAPGQFAGLALYEPPLAVTRPLGGEALVRARAALDAGDPDRAVTIHASEMLQTGSLTLALYRLARPLWRQMVSMAPGQIADNEQIEALGVGVGRYAALDLPVLLMGGGRSQKFLKEALAALADVLPGRPQVITFPGQGHLGPQFAPGKVAQAIGSFAGAIFDSAER